MKSPVYVINPFPFMSPIYLSTHPGPSQIFIILLFNRGQRGGQGNRVLCRINKVSLSPRSLLTQGQFIPKKESEELDAIYVL